MKNLNQLKWLFVLIIGGILFSCNSDEAFDEMDNFNSGSYTFNYKTKMIYNIHP